MNNREARLQKIRSNITNCGYHLYVISGGVCPRYAYTIGLKDRLGHELVFAGGAYFLLEDVKRIIDTALFNLDAKGLHTDLQFQTGILGRFSFGSVDESWVKLLLLGAIDYYENSIVPALQIIPSSEYLTLDIPNLSNAWDPLLEPVWKWLQEVWNENIPKSSTAITNLAALRGQQVTEAMRWEEDQWEIFSGAGPEVLEKDVRVVPLATLVAIDGSLNAVTRLKIGEGVWRNFDEPDWHPWVVKEK